MMMMMISNWKKEIIVISLLSTTLSQTYFSGLDSLSSVNFKWSALQSHQAFDKIEKCFIKYLSYIYGLEGRVFANGPRDLGSISGWVIPKTLKWYLIPPCLTLINIRYVSRVKWNNQGKEAASSHTPRWKGRFLVILLLLLYIYIYKVGNRSRRWPEGPLFNSYNIELLEGALLFSLDCSTLPLIRTL